MKNISDNNKTIDLLIKIAKWHEYTIKYNKFIDDDTAFYNFDELLLILLLRLHFQILKPIIRFFTKIIIFYVLNLYPELIS